MFTVESFADAHSYASRKRAAQQAEQALNAVGEANEGYRWFVAVNEKGRFVPVIHLRSDQMHLALDLIARNVSVIG